MDKLSNRASCVITTIADFQDVLRANRDYLVKNLDVADFFSGGFSFKDIIPAGERKDIITCYNNDETEKSATLFIDALLRSQNKTRGSVFRDVVQRCEELGLIKRAFEEGEAEQALVTPGAQQTSLKQTSGHIKAGFQACLEAIQILGDAPQDTQQWEKVQSTLQSTGNKAVNFYTMFLDVLWRFENHDLVKELDPNYLENQDNNKRRNDSAIINNMNNIDNGPVPSRTRSNTKDPGKDMIAVEVSGSSISEPPLKPTLSLITHNKAKRQNDRSHLKVDTSQATISEHSVSPEDNLFNSHDQNTPDTPPYQPTDHQPFTTSGPQLLAIPKTPPLQPPDSQPDKASPLGDRGTTCCSRAKCSTCPYVFQTQYVDFPNETFEVKHDFTCVSANLIYVIVCTRCNKKYIGETGKRLGDRFVQHLGNIRRKDNTYIADHFKQSEVSEEDCGVDDILITGILPTPGYTKKRRRALENKLILQLGTLVPQGLNVALSRA